MFVDMGDNYYQTDRGKFDAALIYYTGEEYIEVAHTDFDIILWWDESHLKKIKEWSEICGFPIEHEPGGSLYD